MTSYRVRQRMVQEQQEQQGVAQKAPTVVATIIKALERQREEGDVPRQSHMAISDTLRRELRVFDKRSI